ncbi:MAG: protoporphyrinogen oxidase [Nocardioides sp.]|uniref:protoporphyrinogen oxidase n=1 Tax=Nocardioides sp. TaxID=35761 RepID=UPI0039E427DB
MRIVVVGAGIGGLTAARDLVAGGHEVTVLEASSRIGGKLRTAEVAGVRVDVGAEAMLARRPEGVELARSLGLPVVHPTTATSRLWTRGELRALPRSIMGVPTDLDQLAATGVLSARGLARARAEAELPIDVLRRNLADSDLSVGEVVDDRFGAEVTDRLVEPLLGGVYAGRAREISLRAAVPQLAAMVARGPVTPQAAAIPPASGAPVFAGVAGGMGRLTEALAVGLEVRTGVRVVACALRRTGDHRYRVATDGEAFDADGVVLATPARTAGRLAVGMLGSFRCCEHLESLDYADVAVITLAFRTGELPLDGTVSGFLVPPVEGRFIKASTFSFAKWDWVREAGDPLLLVRTSVGRAGEVGALDHTDAELVERSLADLRAAIGPTGRPVDSHVQRWLGALPQYPPGHLRAIERIRAEVAAQPGIALCGAAYDGVGIPAVVASAHRAAAEVVGGIMGA